MRELLSDEQIEALIRRLVEDHGTPTSELRRVARIYERVADALDYEREGHQDHLVPAGTVLQ